MYTLLPNMLLACDDTSKFVLLMKNSILLYGCVCVIATRGSLSRRRRVTCRVVPRHATMRHIIEYCITSSIRDISDISARRRRKGQRVTSYCRDSLIYQCNSHRYNRSITLNRYLCRRAISLDRYCTSSLAESSIDAVIAFL